MKEFRGRPKLARGDNEKLHPNIFRMILHQNERSVDAKGEGLETASSREGRVPLLAEGR